jgi:hypothetical protein
VTKKQEKNTVELASETMLGDLMKMAVDELKAAPDHWHKMSEATQAESIERIEKQCRAAIKTCVHLIASHGFTRLGAKIDSITMKDGIKATLKISVHEAARHSLYDSVGSFCTIVLADVEQFGGGSEVVKADKDQPELPLLEPNDETNVDAPRPRPSNPTKPKRIRNRKKKAPG